MTYQVIARRWRPQNFDEIVFQDHISITIKNSIKKGRISHAYLFAGPKGIGKTTMARVLSKALNCIDGPTDAPCGKCENCIEIKEGASFDVVEIDGASNRGIEDVRELRENVNFAPVKCRYKIYIIDEIHMLTKEAFNALLKTLEEPPEHIVFLFATTEIHQIPETILSRCQRFLFKKIPIETIVNHLKHIIDNEGFKVDGKALYQIARASDGAMRDAQSLLDQVISFSEGEIDERDALAILGVVPIESFLNILVHIMNVDAKQAICEVDRIAMLGVDIPKYVTGFIDVLRTVRLVSNGVSIKEILGFSDEEIAQITDVADGFCDEELSVMFRIASDLQNELRFSANDRINLEMSLLDMIYARKRPSIASILQKFEEKKKTNNKIEDGVGLYKSHPIEEDMSSDVVAHRESGLTAFGNADSIVEKIKDMFHGQIIKKGDK